MSSNAVIPKIPILEGFPDITSNIIHTSRIPARNAEWEQIPLELDVKLVNALESRGIHRLYSHQAESFRKGIAFKDFVVVTPTASGKTLCYNLPVAQTLLTDPSARALYVFPTKALSQDQQSTLNELALGGGFPLKMFTYDGDTPASLRTAARSTGRIIITNPDMLHAGILPNHPKWIQFFSGLRYIIIDEMHSCRGIYGSHVANVLRRLLRIASFYGSRPSFIFCSATIANPAELAHSLSGRDVEVIVKNGSLSGEKMIALYNPPLLDPVQGIRVGTSTESVKIALALLKSGVKTILFARSRVQVELVASYLNEALCNIFNDNAGIVVKPYRSGLLPQERREIERGLRTGSIRGVVSTNALELGIDIGGLDAAVMAGFPGTMASFWQQLGRAGRTGAPSLGVFVASSSPLDQYLVSHPSYFLGSMAEEAKIDPDNPYIFMDHVKCSAFELPFKQGESLYEESPGATPDGSSGATGEALEFLAEQGVVRNTGGRWHWASEGYPGEKISLRSATADNVVIIDITAGNRRVLGEMDRPSAKELIYDNAVYLHLGRRFIVKNLDIANRLCLVEERQLDYWTDAVVKTDIHVLTMDSRIESSGGISVVLGDVLVRSQAEKFKKLRFQTNENIGYGEISLPPEEMQTRALMLVADGHSGAARLLSGPDPAFLSAVLAGAARVMHAMAPAWLLCDKSDLGKVSRIRDPHFEAPVIYFYDKYPGGTGLAEGFSSVICKVAMLAAERIHGCTCHSGCPSCIGVDFAMSVESAPQNTQSAGAEAKRLAGSILLDIGGIDGNTEGST